MFFSSTLPINNSSIFQQAGQSQISTQIIEQSESSPASSQTIESSQSSSQQSNFPTKLQLHALAKSEEFQNCKNNGTYYYLQQKLCDTNLFYPVEGKFARKIPTPFGTVTVTFRPCTDKRFIRFLSGGGTYERVISFLSYNIKDIKKIEEIFEVILEYMTYNVYNSKSLRNDIYGCLRDICENHKDLFEYLQNTGKAKLTSCEEKAIRCQRSEERNTNKKKNACTKPSKNEEEKTNRVMNTLARLCAFLTFCDPCYGGNETGGAETRGLLRAIVGTKQHDFRILLNENFYFFSQKYAYIFARNFTTGKRCDKNISNPFEYMSDLHNSETGLDPTQSTEEVVPSSQASLQNSFANSSTSKQSENDNSDLSAIELSGNDDSYLFAMEPLRN